MRLTNKQVILHHLFEHGSISPLEALVLHRIVRLAPRIQELRDQGYTIQSQWNFDPSGTRYCRYVLPA